ncbi:MAG: SprB repeat-containing protein, partial [Cyclobacteriaceae bacterium]|nr:SprB repeat-containing protein [Cyclobacteriaceae bacterium]
MNQRMWRTVYKSLILTVLALGFVAGEVFAQATFVSARHETLSQREVDVTFNAGITFSGAPTAVGWTVQVNNIGVPITNIGTFGPNVVRVQFDASAIAGHTAGQNFLKPGEVLTVRYTGGGNFTAPGVNAFAFQTSQNNAPFTCAEMEFYQQGNFASVDVCSPVVMDFRQYQYRASLRFRNSSLFDFNRFRVNIQWGDATSSNGLNYYISDLLGTPNVNFIDNNGFSGGNPGLIFTIRPTKNYPAANPTDCSFDATITPFYVGAGICPSISTTTIFPTYDTDNANSGTLALQPSPLPTSNQVCLGTNVNMQFSDATLLNCRAAIEPIVPNESQRHIRIVYGSTNNGAPGNIPDIRVTLPAVLGGGTTIVTNNNATGTFVAGAFTPTSVGAADFNGVIPIASPVTAATGLTYMGQITTTQTTNQAVGQRFYVRIDYWDICNPYNAGNPASPAPVSIQNWVEIVDAPPLPVVAYTANHCDTDGNGTFTITATRTQAGSTLRWYRDAALTDLEKSSTGSATFNPITEGSPALAKATTNAERVINYYVTEQWGTGLNCTSPVRTITFKITDTNNGGVIDHPNEIGTTQVVAICSGDNPPAFTNTTSASGGDGTNYAYQWEQSTTSAVAGFANIGGETGTTYNPPALAQTTWYRRRVSSGYCNDAYSNVFQIRVDVPVVAGAINGTQIICETPGNPANLSNNTLASGGDGSNYAYQWEESTTAPGVPPFNTIVGATGSSYNPPAGVSVTTYYRRRVTSGVCTTGSNNIAYSNVITVTVDQDINPGSIGNAQVICSGDNPTAISSITPASGGNGSTYGYQWQQSTTSAVAGFANIGGATATTYDPPVLAQTTWFQRIASSGVQCAPEISNVIEVTVEPLPTASNPTGGGAVCAGNPAPDIVWNLTGRPPFHIHYTVTLNGGTVFDVDLANYTPPEALPPYTFTITNPNPPVTFGQPPVVGDSYVYQMTVLDDDVLAATPSCTATALGNTRTVSVGGTPPVLDPGTALSPNNACDDGASTANPTLNFSLDAGSASQVGFILNYTVDGSTNRTKTFNTDAAGDPTVPITFSDAELNNTAGSPHTVRIVSIQSPAGCLGPVGLNLSFTVNPRPAAPINPVNANACDNPGTGVALSVDDPGAGFEIEWSTAGPALSSFAAAVPGSGAESGTRNRTFTPTTSATAIYYAFIRNTTTGCFGNIGTAVTQTQILKPTAADAGLAQADLCTTSTTLAATAADKGGSGVWTEVGGPTPGLVITTPTSAVSTVTGLPQNAPGGAATTTTLRWTVSSSVPAACATSFDDVVLTVNALPKAVSLTPNLCETVAGGNQVTNFDLTTLDATVTDGAAGVTVKWFAGPGLTNQILPANTPQTIANGGGFNDFFFQLSTAVPCTNAGSVVFTVNSRPAAAPQSYTYCEDAPPGSLQASGIDLTTASIKTDIISGAPAAQRTITWHPTLADAIANTNSLASPNNVTITANTDVFARVVNTVTTCENQAKVTLQYQGRPIDNRIKDAIGNPLTDITLPLDGNITVCASNSLILFQLDPSFNPGATAAWNIPPPSYTVPANAFGPGNPAAPTPEFEVLSPVNSFFVILRFNYSVSTPPATFTSLYGTGIPITVAESFTGSCSGNPITLTVDVAASPPKPIIAGSASVCANQAGVVFSVTNPTSGTYNWTVPAGASIIAGQGSSSITVNWGSFNGNVNVNHTSGSGCTAPPADPFAVIANGNPMLDPTLSTSVCSNDPIGIILASTGGIVATSFKITNVSVAPGLTPSSRPVINPVTSTEIQNDVFENLTGGNLNVRYTVIPVSATGCEGPPVDVTATIKPQPILDPGLGKTICSRTATGIVLKVATGSFPADQYEITQIDNPAALVATAGNPITGIFTPTEIADDIWVNTTTAAATIGYHIRPINSSSTCIGATIVVNVVVNPEPVVNPNGTTICSGDMPGITLTSPLAGSTFAWTIKSISGAITGASNGTGATITNTLVNSALVQGSVTYEVKATGALGDGFCPGQPIDVTILVDPSPIANDISQTVCSDAAGGSTFNIDLTTLESTVNSTGTVTFSWFQDMGKTTPIATPTNYNLSNNIPVFVEVDNGSCTKLAAVTYTINPLPAVSATITSAYNGFDISCVGASDGQITAVPTLGTGPYQFSINGGGTFFNTGVFNGLSVAGNPYVVRVKDAKGCIVDSAPINLTPPTAVTAVVAKTKNYNGEDVSCQSSANGEITITPGGGTGTYTFKLLELPSNTSGDASGIYTGLRAGTYTFVVKDNNNCQFTTPTITITEPAPITASGTLTSPVSCNGASDGVITITASGGTLVGPNYTYTLNQAPGTINNTGVFSGLAAGNYTVTVEDDNTCTKVTSTVSVTQPSPLTAFASVSSNYNGAKISCTGASDAVITGVANGGNGGYTYVLDQDLLNTTGNATGIYTGVGPGNYTITVTDAGLCNVTSASVNVTEPAPIVASSLVTGAISCNGGNDGKITVSGSGGTGAYTFIQINPAGPTNATGIFTGLADGTYDFEVRDLNNCSDITSITINQPAQVTATASVTSNYNGSEISCNGASDGVITITGAGGTGTLQYVFDQFPLTNTTGKFSGTFTGVPAGTGYTFTVTDSKSCTIVTLPVDITAPAAITANGTVTSNYNGEDISCVGSTDGQITITAGGGTGAYTYRIDQEPLNTSGNVSGIYTGLGAGIYTATVRDANNCFVVTAPITITPPPTLTGSASVTSNYFGRQISCNGASDGEITVTAGGGVPVYAYELVEIPLNTSGAATGVFSGIPAGTYTFKITDQNSCTKITTPITINEPAVLAASATVTSNFNGQQLSCFGASDGTIKVTATGGTTAYAYSLVEIPGNTTGSASGIFTGIPSGTYTFTVTDVNACNVVTAGVTITDPTQVTASAAVTSSYNGSQVSCNGASDGVIKVTASGGTGSLQYVFDQIPGNTTGQFSGTFTGVPANTGYTFTIKDVNNCAVVTAPIDVTEPTLVAGSGTVTSNYNGEDISCVGSTDGEITILANGGTGAYTYRLDQAPLNTTGNITGVYTGLGAGVYTATIRDANSCFVITAPITITAPPALTGSASVTSLYNGRQITCNGASDGEITVTAGGGVPGYAYELVEIPTNTTGAVNGIFTGIPAGTYTFKITDQNNCSKITTPVTISEPAVLAASAMVTSNFNGQQVSCFGASDGSIKVTTSGGTTAYAYVLVEIPGNITGAASGIFTGIPAGTYTIDVTDANGCSLTTAPVTISEPTGVTASAAVTSNYNGQQVSCNGADDATVTITAGGGTGTYIYEFDQFLVTNVTGKFSG